MQSKHAWGVGSIVAVAGLFLTFVSTFGSPWALLGWMTPNSHAKDIEAVRAEFVVALDSERSTAEEFRNEWRCSEWAEDLNELYEEHRREPSDRVRDKIDDVRKRMDESGCDRWEDY